MAITAQILLIFEDYVKKFSPINGSVDWKFLEPHVITSQDKYIESYLGTDLIQKLKTDSQAGTITGAYANLLDNYVRKALMWWTLYEAHPNLNVKIDNATLVVRTSEDSTRPSDAELKTVRDGFRVNAEYYTQRMIDYIRYNLASFPEYNTNVRPDRSPIKIGSQGTVMEISGNRRARGIFHQQAENPPYGKYEEWLP
jgi:hypothetical protein